MVVGEKNMNQINHTNVQFPTWVGTLKERYQVLEGVQQGDLPWADSRRLP